MLHFWELHLIIYRSVLNYSCHWIQIYATIDLEGKILNDLGSVFGDPQVKENLTLVLLSVVRSHLLRLLCSLLFLLICILCACTTNRLPECDLRLKVIMDLLRTFQVSVLFGNYDFIYHSPHICCFILFSSIFFFCKKDV